MIPTNPSAPAAVGSRPRDRQVSSYADLSRRVKAAGLLNRRRGWYVGRIAAVALALAGVVAGVTLLNHSWLVLLLAGALALVLTQCAFLGHDGAHRQMFGSNRANEIAGRVLAAGAAGLSYGWWMGKHSKHHQAPNQLGVDTDVESKVLSFHDEAADGRRGVLKWVTRRQGWLFFPLLLLEGLNLHVDSMMTLTARTSVKRRWVDLALIATHWALYLTFLFLLLPPGKVAAFVGVHLAVLGVYMGGAFAPNHTGMPIVARGAKLDYLRRQVLMSRNVSGGAPVSFLMGGLNYQIEHHLFPSMPRPNLHKVRPMVRDFCAEHGIDYTETTLPGAYRAIVAHLNEVGLRARDPFTCPVAQQLRT
ncbi:acyl-CoA desaturase [Angustibacter aerolatus]